MDFNIYISGTLVKGVSPRRLERVYNIVTFNKKKLNIIAVFLSANEIMDTCFPM